MNASETEIVKGKIKECQEFINRQHCLPKAKRNTKAINAIKKKSKVMNAWLK